MKIKLIKRIEISEVFFRGECFFPDKMVLGKIYGFMRVLEYAKVKEDDEEYIIF
jgi:hypothetical protein